MSTSGFDTTHPRFLRPIDVARIRRNQNRIQVQRVLRIARNVTLALIAVVFGLWIYRRTQSDIRFAVKSVEVAGVVHTPKADVERITARYTGANLFRLDIEEVRKDLGTISWIRRIDIEKKLPDTLRIRVTEREPVALARVGSEIRLVDASGAAFAALSPQVGAADLPLITGAGQADLARCVELVSSIRSTEPDLYARMSEIRPVAPDGFALFDRDLGAFVFVKSEDLSQKWRTLHAIARAERIGAGGIAYADLRFDQRIVIKPRVSGDVHEGATHATN